MTGVSLGLVGYRYFLFDFFKSCK